MSDAPEEKKKDRTKPATGLKTLPKMSSPGHVNKYDETNLKFSKENAAFIAACGKAGVDATPRQASKWRNKKGKAYLQGR